MSTTQREMTRKVYAGAKWIRISPYKVREVAALIKGKPIDEARRILAFTPKVASHEVSKVLEAAIANAEANFQIPQEDLVVKTASADEAMTIKRFRPRAQGRAYRIRKRTSHIHIVLERVEKVEAETARRPRRAQKAKTKATEGGAPAEKQAATEETKKKSRRTKAAAPKKEGEE